MDHIEVGRHWEANADAWTALARAGYDVYRDFLNTPAFLDMLPDVKGQRGLDIGCGEGGNTRTVAGRGAKMTAIDIAGKFIALAKEEESRRPMGIEYRVASAVELPFAEGAFDFATAFMSLMDIPEYDKVLVEALRVLKPGGFLQFSITHPCTDTPHRRNLRDANRTTYALEVGGYYAGTPGRVDEWLFGAAPPEVRKQYRPFRVPRFHHTLSDWLNAAIRAGFAIEEVREPFASDAVIAQCRDVQDTQVMPYFLHVRCRRPRQ